ncbi:MAG: glucosamine-6-phosphate deaminase [Flavobacteriaceae bacterium]
MSVPLNLNYVPPGKYQETRFEKIHNVTAVSEVEGARWVAEEIATQIRNCIDRPFVLGLATGSSPIRVYQYLVQMHREEGLSFKNVITFNLDEYYPVAPTDVQSYHHFMHEHLFNHIDINSENVHIPKGQLSPESIRPYCQSYDEKIADLGGLDFQLLGIGRTGHIGFNEPGSHRNSATRLISLDPVTRADAAKDFNGIDKVPTKAITMGIDTIMNAKRIILLAWGQHKAPIVSRTIEGAISEAVPATFLQEHNNITCLLDQESSSDLTRINTPWLVRDCGWTDDLKKKAIIWLCEQTKKSILKLTQRDYNENGLSDLLATAGRAYDLNIWMFNQLQHTITGWPGGKPNFSDENRPERAEPAHKRCLIFSPHPDDDVISMGGTFARLIDQGHEVHVAYQTSGNIAVSDEDALRFLEVYENTFTDDTSIADLKKELIANAKVPVATQKIRTIKGAIRRSECMGAARFLKLPVSQLHFMDLPFYETGMVKKKDPTQADVDQTIELIKKLRPHQIYAAGDLADPHGTHRICLDVLFEALKTLKSESFMKDCWVWLYRGAWQEWDIHEIEMAIPISPDQVIQKRNAILYHQSQKDRVMFQGEDNREFWLRAEERNRDTALKYNDLGMAEYESMEAFKRHFF